MRYKRADNCGPVPYPDGSGQMLVDEIVEGDGWEDLVPLGYVVRVAEKPGKRFPNKRSKVTRPRANKAKDSNSSSNIQESISKNDIVYTSDSAGVADEASDGSGVDRVDSAPSGSADAEGPTE